MTATAIADQLVRDAARALAVGDPLGALKRIARLDDAPALALHGIAMSQLGDFARAAALLDRASRKFSAAGARDARSRLDAARCVVARAEVALAARELIGRDRALAAAAAALDAAGDRGNALHARLVAARRLIVLGQVARAEAALAGLALDGAPAMTVAIARLLAGELAVRRIRPRLARAAFAEARRAAVIARIPALIAEVDRAAALLDAPAARWIAAGAARVIALDEVEAVLAAPDGIVIDACRRAVHIAGATIGLARRPVLFALARALGEAWPGDASRAVLIAAAFDVARGNASHRARLRVELVRLRRALAGHAEIRATGRGFALGVAAGAVGVLAPPVGRAGDDSRGDDSRAADGSRGFDDEPAVLALLGDGAAWSTAGLALALGTSARTVQRSLAALEARGAVRASGAGPTRRWLTAPIVGVTTALVLPATLSLGLTREPMP